MRGSKVVGKLAVGLGLCLTSFSGFAATNSNQVIVKFKNGYSNSKSNFARQSVSLNRVGSFNAKSQIQAFELPVGISRTGMEESLEELRKNPAVEYVQEDHVLEFRGEVREDVITTSDPKLPLLWGLESRNSSNPMGSNAQKVWKDFGTGGEDALGNEIVVVVIDGGFDLNHEDLQANLWVNEGEIPNNGIDDDNNGYVDDVNGWNFIDNNNQITSASHGTHVAGIVGAEGDNGIGVTGVNWNVKIIPIQISMRGLKTSQVIAAYEYALDLKKKFVLSNGKRGANVVITNSSFGRDGADCNSRQFAVWNDVYNRLGEYGILSAVATSNNGWDVDLMGDVPSACKSDYVVSVTNVASFGFIMGAWGGRHVDLAAPGYGITSTLPWDTYGSKSGTSMATPLVAGAVALLHSVASEDMARRYKNDPADTALLLKDILLESVHEVPNFELYKMPVRSNGTLDLYEAAKAVANY